MLLTNRMEWVIMSDVEFCHLHIQTGSKKLIFEGRDNDV